MSRRLKIFLYLCFTAVSLAGALLLTFPYDALGRRLETMAAQAMPGATLVINRIGPALPFGLKLGDVTFTLPGKGSDPGAAIQIDKLRITPAWTKLLTLKPAVAVQLGMLGGEMTGVGVLGKDSRHIEIKIDPSHALQLDSGGMLEKLSGAQVEGALSGRISLTVDAKGTVTTGDATLQIDGARLKSAKVMGFPLPATDFGTPELELSIEKGDAKIEHFTVKSSDLDATVTGTINLRPDLMASMVRGTVKLKPTDAWLARNPTIKAGMSLAGPMKKPDGTIELPLSGPLYRPLSLPGFGKF